ncbi:LysR family transcriptional regulator (plasmid) [Photobacterium sp. DA100]|uniref:LysR family transcriptional regulator n=1 Tax=Photobacterium sp. DA100 TaxID=3027472 RepID=UPI00247A9ACB|nr:LysR family transcriptional regulator [Photobacterium sp. DA100]WEM44094.1 LysR family transcriptional regulator [Photobacterium sp. DA100]
MKQLDLNLLRVFLVLLKTQNTRMAGDALSLSQPAVSKALRRLRNYFDDELFTRVHTGLKPTPRALELGEQLPMIMESLDAVILDTPNFDPLEYKGKITIAINGFISNWLGARLCLALVQDAPNAQVNIVNWGSQTLQKLLDGEIQAAINYSPVVTNKQFTHQVIGDDDFVGLVRIGHPMAGKVLSQEEVKKGQYASLVVPGWNDTQPFIEKHLSAGELKIQARSSYLHTLLDVIKQSELILPCSKQLAHYLHCEFDYLSFPEQTPEEIKKIVLVESHNMRMHPMHQWIKSKILTASQANIGD